MTEAPAPEIAKRLDFATSPGPLPYLQIVDCCFVERIAGGLQRAAYRQALDRLAPSLARLRAPGSHPRDRNIQAILSLPAREDDLALVAAHAERLAASFDEIVVLGTGGSSLGGQALAALAADGFGLQPGQPRLRFLDNVDSSSFERLLAGPALARTGFVAISKSGSTPETLIQLLVCFDRLSAMLGEAEAARRFTVITEPSENPLRQFAQRRGMPIIDHDPDLGGRFSVLSLVGLLPARLAGVDVAVLRKGASTVLDALRAAPSPEDFPPAVGAAISTVLQRDCGVATTVLMPYVDRLAPFGMWFRQLWAESVGKEGKGTTPVRALGTVDQHSQLQLYLDGPADKMFTLVVARQAGTGRRVPPGLAADPRLGYLGGRTMGDLLAAEQRATYETIAAAGRPVRVLSVAVADAESLGALLMHFMIETILAAELLGVDPFGQPAVEDGKRRARAYLADADLTGFGS